MGARVAPKPFSKGSKMLNDTNNFKGETVRIKGQNFQLHAERRNKSQFMDTMEALKICASAAYKSNINSLNMLFTELKVPTLNETKEQEEIFTAEKSSRTTVIISKIQEMIYSEKVKH